MAVSGFQIRKNKFLIFKEFKKFKNDNNIMIKRKKSQEFVHESPSARQGIILGSDFSIKVLKFNFRAQNWHYIKDALSAFLLSIVIEPQGLTI